MKTFSSRSEMHHCRRCWKEFPCENTVKWHLAKECRNLTCLGCKKTFNKVGHLYRHMRVMGKQKKLNKPAPCCPDWFIADEREKCEVCEKCHREFVSSDTFVQHKKQCKGWVCKRCGAVFNKRYNLKTHVSYGCRSELPCPLCFKAFANIGNFRLHVRACEERETKSHNNFACRCCSQHCDGFPDLLTHWQTKGCESRCLSEGLSLRNVKKEVPERQAEELNGAKSRFTCAMCGFTLKDGVPARKHYLRCHTLKKKPVKCFLLCQQCGSAIPKTLLKSHKEVCSSRGSHAPKGTCTLCGQVKLGSRLIEHQLHACPKFTLQLCKCLFCDLQFASRNDRRIHSLKIHKRERPERWSNFKSRKLQSRKKKKKRFSLRVNFKRETEKKQVQDRKKKENEAKFHNVLQDLRAALVVAFRDYLKSSIRQLRRGAHFLCRLRSDFLFGMRLARLKASRQWSLRVALRPQLHLVCFTCRRTFSNPRVYEIHQLRHARMMPYSCRECRLEFCTFIEVRQHMQSRHRLRCGRNVGRCRRCGETLPRRLQDKLQHFSACRRSQRCPAWFVTGVVGSENASKELILNNVEDNLSDRSDLSIPFFSAEDMKALPDLEKETKAALDWTCQRCGLTILSDDHLRTHLCISLMEPETSNSQSLLTLPMTQSNSRSLSTDTCCETSNSQSRSTFATKDSNSQCLDATVKGKLSSQASTDSDSRSFDTNVYNDTSNSRIKSLTNTIDGRDVKLEEAVFPRYNVDLDADMNISLESFGSPVLDYRSCSNSPVKTARWVCKDCSFPFNTRKLFREHRQKFHSAKRLQRKRQLPDKEKAGTPPLVISVEDGPSMVISLDDEEEDMCYVSMKRQNSESVSLPSSLQAIKSEPQELSVLEKEAVNSLHLMEFDESNTKPLTPLLPETWCDKKSPTYSRQFSSDVASSSKSSFSEYCSSVRESNTIIASSLNSSSTPEIEDHTNFGSAAEMFVSLEDDEATRFSLFSPRETQEEDSNFIESGVKMEETSVVLSTTNCEESFSDKANKTDHDTTSQHYENVVDPERLHDLPEKSNSTDKENFESAAKFQRLPSSRSQTKMLNQVSGALATKPLDTTSNYLQSSEKEISELVVKQKRPKSTITRTKVSGNETSTFGIKKNRAKSCSKRLKEIKAVVMKTQLKSSLNRPDINKLRIAPDNVSRDQGIENPNFGSSSGMLISMEDDETTRFSLIPSSEPKKEALNAIERRVKNNETVPTDPLTIFKESPPTETGDSDHDIKVQPYEKFHIKDRPCGFSAKLNDADKENYELSASNQRFPSSSNRTEILKGNCKPDMKNLRLKLAPNFLEPLEKKILETNAPKHGVKLTSNFFKQSEKEVSVLSHELQKSTSKCLKRSENEVLETMVAKNQLKLGNDNHESPMKEIPKLVSTNQPPDDDSKGVKPPHLQHNAIHTENKKHFRQNRNSVDKPAIKHLQSVDETLNSKKTRPHEQLPIQDTRLSEEGRSAQKRPGRDILVKPHYSFTDPEVNALPSSPTIDHKNLPAWADASWDTKRNQDTSAKPVTDRPKGRRKGAHTCVVCDQSFVTRFRLRQHQKTEGHSSSRSFRRSLNSWLCNFCPLRFPVRDDLRAHIQTCHSSVSLPSDQPPKAEDLHEQHRVVCGFCEQTAADLRQLRIHLQVSQHQPKPLLKINIMTR